MLKWARPAHAALRVRDLERSVAFYRQVLGFELEKEQEIPARGLRLATLSRGDFILELLSGAEPAFSPAGGLAAPSAPAPPSSGPERSSSVPESPAGPWDHLALYVEDLEEAVEELRRQGVREEGPIRTAMGGLRLYFFRGPDGERWELIETGGRPGES